MTGPLETMSLLVVVFVKEFFDMLGTVNLRILGGQKNVSEVSMLTSPVVLLIPWTAQDGQSKKSWSI